MAGIDKMNEFYTCLKRFAFLSECYAPEEIEGAIHKHVQDAFKVIKDYSERPDIKKRIEESEEYFDDAHNSIRRQDIAHILARVLEEVSR